MNTSHSNVLACWNLVISGNMPLFRFFEENKHFERFSVTDPQIEHQVHLCIRQKMAEDFPGMALENNGIMRAAWNTQMAPSQDVWPHKLVDRYGFPQDVQYVNGDVLVNVYRLIFSNGLSISSYIDDRICRFGRGKI
jgi:hypothetical protein